MNDAAWYEILDEPSPGTASTLSRVHATELTNGPWEQGFQHAGPPAALLTRAIRRLGGAPDDALPARLSFDIPAPVPTGDLVLRAEMIRPGRRVALAEASLAAPDRLDRPLMSLRAWLVRRRAEPLPTQLTTRTNAAPSDGDVQPRPPGWLGGYVDTIEWRWSVGSFGRPGPATVWTRQLVPLIDGEEPTGVERLVAIADSASGISGIANPADLLFVNTDLTLHLTRAPVGEVWMQAQTWVDPGGVGRTLSEIGDADGALAQGSQCLYVEPRG